MEEDENAWALAKKYGCRFVCSAGTLRLLLSKFSYSRNCASADIPVFIRSDLVQGDDRRQNSIFIQVLQDCWTDLPRREFERLVVALKSVEKSSFCFAKLNSVEVQNWNRWTF